MTVCDLCSENEACGAYIVEDSHPFSDHPTIMNLCSYCLSDLKEAQVHLKRIKGKPINEIKLPEKLRNKSDKP